MKTTWLGMISLVTVGLLTGCGPSDGSPENENGTDGDKVIDMYVSKFDTDGNDVCTFQYGTDNEDAALDVVVDSSDNVYVTGWTHRDFDGHTYIGGSIYNNGGDIFVMKFNSSCVKQNSILFGSTHSDAPTGMTIDSEDNWNDPDFLDTQLFTNASFFFDSRKHPFRKYKVLTM